MKKTFLLIFLILVIALAACAPPDWFGGVVVRGTPMPAVDIESVYAPDETIVYVTSSGSKYHREGCEYLEDSCIPISLEQAIAEGKTPCSRCWPDQ